MCCFDCSSQYKGSSINQHLMPGQDLTNQFIGELNRFRLEPVAFMADIQAMFYQVRVPEDQRSFLRFLWWDEGNLSSHIQEYEMCVHLFGAVSSPSISNYALRKTAIDNKECYGKDAAEVIMKNFYVDDLLKSVSSENYAGELIQRVQSMCAAGGFKQTKFISNSKSVLMSIPEDKRREGVKDYDLIKEKLPSERALGVHWNVETDEIGFKVSLKEKKTTKRGMLLILSSFYDPLGLASPFVLKGRKILQELCQRGLQWDEKIPEDYQRKWEVWKQDLVQLEKIGLKRCVKPANFGKIVECSLHNFSDASELGYGESSYIRLVDEYGKIHCTLLMGKARVTPLKFVSIPRLELVAAVLAVKISAQLKREMGIQVDEENFWTVLDYIKNESRAFKTCGKKSSNNPRIQQGEPMEIHQIKK